MEKFQVVIVEDVPLELKGTEGIFKNEIPEAVIIGTADNEQNYFKLMKQHQPPWNNRSLSSYRSEAPDVQREQRPAASEN